MSWRRPHPGWIVAGLLGLLLLAAVVGENGVLQLWRLRKEVEALHRDVQALEAENDRLSQAITELRDDPTVMERIAREELGLVRPGERVLRFPRSAGPAAPPAAPVPGPERAP
ncbi:MAG TPA: septum formation initiator family protein [Methylomirabilota bacterium]|jgi:cell division protein FtsB|nr:septum formation initiator family protein [Methylomirabilota bacterium]